MEVRSGLVNQAGQRFSATAMVVLGVAAVIDMCDAAPGKSHFQQKAVGQRVEAVRREQAFSDARLIGNN
jgi:hypothetical protein